MSEEKKLTWQDARHERRTLKQKLFRIRRAMAGEGVELTKELLQLKKFYEAQPGFTRWGDFPEKWDIGDPHRVKEAATAFNDVDKANIEKILGQSYDKIVSLECNEE